MVTQLQGGIKTKFDEVCKDGDAHHDGKEDAGVKEAVADGFKVFGKENSDQLDDRLYGYGSGCYGSIDLI